MLVSEIKAEDLSVELVDRLLYQGLEDTGEKVDCIVVLGSKKASQYRVPVAVAAYKAGRAQKILLCGGTVRDFPEGSCSEAENMRRTAVKLGVKEADILLEDRSESTMENLVYALRELRRHFGTKNIHSVLLVTTAYHMRRSLSIARHLFPEEIRVIPCPANDNNTRRDNWMNKPMGTKRAKEEVLKIARYAKMELIPDFEI